MAFVPATTFSRGTRFAQQKTGAHLIRDDVIVGDVTTRDLPATNPVAACD